MKAIDTHMGFYIPRYGDSFYIETRYDVQESDKESFVIGVFQLFSGRHLIINIFDNFGEAEANLSKIKDSLN